MSDIAPTFPAVQAICRAFVERSSQLGYKGKKRDHAALDFACGAAMAAEVAGNSLLASHLSSIVWLVSIRGYAEMAVIAAKVSP